MWCQRNTGIPLDACTLRNGSCTLLLRAPSSGNPHRLRLECSTCGQLKLREWGVPVIIKELCATVEVTRETKEKTQWERLHVAYVRTSCHHPLRSDQDDGVFCAWMSPFQQERLVCFSFPRLIQRLVGSNWSGKRCVYANFAKIT